MQGQGFLGAGGQLQERVGVKVELGAGRGIGVGVGIIRQSPGKTGGAGVVLAEVFEGCEEGGPEAVVDEGEVAGECGLNLGLGNDVGHCERPTRAPRDSAGRGGERGGNVEEDYVPGGGGIEDGRGGVRHWRRGEGGMFVCGERRELSSALLSDAVVHSREAISETTSEAVWNCLELSRVISSRLEYSPAISKAT